MNVFWLYISGIGSNVCTYDDVCVFFCVVGFVRVPDVHTFLCRFCLPQFIYRVSSLWLELGVSSIIVVGGCGDYFDVHNTAVLVDNYVVSDVTARAHSVSAAGRGWWALTKMFI